MIVNAKTFKEVRRLSRAEKKEYARKKALEDESKAMTSITVVQSDAKKYEEHLAKERARLKAKGIL